MELSIVPLCVGLLLFEVLAMPFDVPAGDGLFLGSPRIILQCFPHTQFQLRSNSVPRVLTVVNCGNAVYINLVQFAAGLSSSAV